MLLTTAALSLCACAVPVSVVDASSALAHATSNSVISRTADAPLTAAEYASSLTRGVVATWAEFDMTIEAYNKQWPQMIAKVSDSPHSFDHVRLRVSGGDSSMNETWQKLDAPVYDSLDAGLQVIVAYKGWVNGTTAAEVHSQVVAWWTATAEHYASASHRLAFDVFIEIGGIMCNGRTVHKTGARTCPLEMLASDFGSLNALYHDVVAAIRKVSPTRVVAMPPGKLDRPWSLSSLVVPSSCGVYCMGEFHIVASGPCTFDCTDTAGDFSWTGENGTHAEREKLRTAVADAVTWREGKGGLPVWTGAFMCGPYNHPEKGNMTLSAQAAFCGFYTSILAQHHVGWAVLVAGDFLNETAQVGHAEWLADMLPLRDTLLQ